MKFIYGIYQNNSIRHKNKIIMGWNTWHGVSVNIEKFIIITAKSKWNPCKLRILVRNRTPNIILGLTSCTFKIDEIIY